MHNIHALDPEEMKVEAVGDEFMDDVHSAHTCTMGPSLPQGKPPETLSVTPTALHNSVFARTSRGMATPLRYVFISGTPDPAAAGSACSHIHANPFKV